MLPLSVSEFKIRLLTARFRTDLNPHSDLRCPFPKFASHWRCVIHETIAVSSAGSPKTLKLGKDPDDGKGKPLNDSVELCLTFEHLIVQLYATSFLLVACEQVWRQCFQVIPDLCQSFMLVTLQCHRFEGSVYRK